MKIRCIEDRHDCNCLSRGEIYEALEESWEAHYCVLNDKGEKWNYDRAYFVKEAEYNYENNGKYIQCINNDNCSHLSLGGIYKINSTYDDFYFININNKFYSYHKNRFIFHDVVRVKCIKDYDEYLIIGNVYEVEEIGESCIKIKKRQW